MNSGSRLLELYDLLLNYFGPQDWWPGDSPFEIIIGAVLTQNTAWTNVEKAINNLKAAHLMDFEAMEAMPDATLAQLIRPCGYYNLKTNRLRNLLTLIRNQYDGDLDSFLSENTNDLRRALLSVKGIGPETADSIILYAAEKPIFVVDAYTHRILSRHNIIDPDDSDYHQIQELFMGELPEDTQLYNEYHALIVMTGKDFCKKSKPRCQECPLEALLKFP